MRVLVTRLPEQQTKDRDLSSNSITLQHTHNYRVYYLDKLYVPYLVEKLYVIAIIIRFLSELNASFVTPLSNCWLDITTTFSTCKKMCRCNWYVIIHYNARALANIINSFHLVVKPQHWYALIQSRQNESYAIPSYVVTFAFDSLICIH